MRKKGQPVMGAQSEAKRTEVLSMDRVNSAERVIKSERKKAALLNGKGKEACIIKTSFQSRLLAHITTLAML